MSAQQEKSSISMNQPANQNQEAFDPTRLLSIVEVRGFAGGERWHHVVVCYTDETKGVRDWMTATAHWIGVDGMEIKIEDIRRPLTGNWANRQALEKFIELRMSLEDFKYA